MSETPIDMPHGDTVLIVDDTPANLAIVVESLENHGLRVIVAQDGEEGLSRAEFAQPDLILLDVMMPGCDGFEVCRRLKANAETRDIPVIFMTSLAEIDDKVRGFEAGAVDYVTKPLHIAEVIARVDTHLKLRAMQEQLEAQNAELQQYRTGLEQQVAERTAELQASNRSVHHMAFYDALTELPNRALLTDRIRQTIADAAWHGHQFGLMLLDLDRFKDINETLGHGMGDELLRAVADRLLQIVRIYDTVARFGGDEFGILLPQVRESDDLALLARKIVESFEVPFNIFGKELFISTSIGIAIYPADSAEIDALFKYADSAMYHAKKMGRNNFQFYSHELTARSSEKMVLEAALRKARKNHELELYYQPQVDLATGRIVSSEALLRWQHPEHGLVAPDRFIPLAEETGLIVGIGEWVLQTACRTAALWNRERSVPLRIAVNLSMRQFIQNDLLSSVRGILDETQCQPAWIKLEITESLLLEDSQDILAMLNAFDDMGLAISIDDFGTGYSALSYLNRFPVSQIKIDRSFVRDIPADQDKSELVKAIISIAHALNLELVAEGVETTEQAAYLHRHGCPLAQGYLYGKPMPQIAFEALLAEQNA